MGWYAHPLQSQGMTPFLLYPFQVSLTPLNPRYGTGYHPGQLTIFEMQQKDYFIISCISQEIAHSTLSYMIFLYGGQRGFHLRRSGWKRFIGSFSSRSSFLPSTHSMRVGLKVVRGGGWLKLLSLLWLGMPLLNTCKAYSSFRYEWAKVVVKDH